jgi:hypothetical protein
VNAFSVDARVIDLILLLMACEAIVLAVVHARGGGGIAPLRLLPNLLAGAFLMLALRAALSGAGNSSVALWLLLGLGGHLADLATRWERRSSRR